MPCNETNAQYMCALVKPTFSSVFKNSETKLVNLCGLA